MPVKEMFSKEELKNIRTQFLYVDRDRNGSERLFLDNAGGALRLRAAEEAFHQVDELPDCSEHSNRTARYLDEVEQQGRKDLMECVFHASNGVLFPGYTASQLMMEICRIFAANAKGTNVVTTALEHPSAYDGMQYYAEIWGREFRVAGVNRQSGGVDAETVISLIDRNTAILSCMHASNISGYIYDVETIFRRAREINPDILIICDAVQHAPHGLLYPERLGVDAMTFAPYKYFSVRGFGVAWLSGRAAGYAHHKLLGKAPEIWELGSPAPAHFAAFSSVTDYVAALGADNANALAGDNRASRSRCFDRGMERIAAQERYLLDLALNGDGIIAGLRQTAGLKVKMDGADLSRRDFIIGIEFDNISCEQATVEYEKRGVIVFERSSSSIYSKRMLEAFDSKGVVRVSPLHVHSKEDMEHFLEVTKEITMI